MQGNVVPHVSGKQVQELERALADARMQLAGEQAARQHLESQLAAAMQLLRCV